MRADASAVLLCAALALGCSRREAEAPAARRQVRCAPVESVEVTDAIELRGTVSPLPDRDAQIAPQVAGRIVQLLVRQGDQITVGQPVARIDGAVLVDQAKEAEAALARTRAERRNAEATRVRVE